MDARQYYSKLDERRQSSVRMNTSSLQSVGIAKPEAFLKALAMDKKLFDELDRRYEL